MGLKHADSYSYCRFFCGKKGHFEDPCSILYQKNLYWDADLRTDRKSLLCVEIFYLFIFLEVPACCRLGWHLNVFMFYLCLQSPVERKVLLIRTRRLILLVGV